MTVVPGWGRTGPDIVAEMEMVQTNWCGPFLVVEGPSDECFFASRVRDDVYIIEANGRLNVEATFSILDSDPNHGGTAALGVIDEDYDWLVGYVVGSANILKFDPRDLEGLLLRSSALECVLAEFADRMAVRSFEAQGVSVRNAVLLRAELFGRIRMYNSLHHGVSLRSLKPQRFCDVPTWNYRANEVLDEAVRLGVAMDVATLQAGVNSLVPPTVWHGVRGHDMLDILVGGLKGVLGGAGNLSVKDVERVLRQSIQNHELRASGFFARLSGWQTAKGTTYM